MGNKETPFGRWIRFNHTTKTIKKMDDTKMVYLIACGVLDKKHISDALCDDAKLRMNVW
jgi:hypothetical protein